MLETALHLPDGTMARDRRARSLASIALTIATVALTSSTALAQRGLPELPPVGTPEIRAQLTARQFTTLSSEMSARIDNMRTRVGERFQQGDVLVVFDCATLKAQQAGARAVVDRADKTFQINGRLYRLKSIGNLELEVSAAELQKAKADLAAADAAVTKCTIAAPFAGVTVDLKAREFQYATPGQPLLEILDDRLLEIEFIAPSRWLGWLKPGSAFQVHIEETDRSYRARVTRLGGRVDPVSQSVKVLGEITDAPPELLPGMSGRIVIAPP